MLSDRSLRKALRVLIQSAEEQSNDSGASLLVKLQA
jgi:hypothetical protein